MRSGTKLTHYRYFDGPQVSGRLCYHLCFAFPGVSMEPAYRRSRKEAIVAGIIWLIAAVWVLVTCSLLTYGRTVYPIGGIPNWALWGIFLPWLVFLIVNIWYSLFYLRDDDAETPPDSGPETADTE
jgi:hypothetical protein